MILFIYFDKPSKILFADWDNMSINQRYSTNSAAIYRDKISTLAEGREWDLEEAKKRIRKSSNQSSNNTFKHSKSASAISQSYQDGTFDQTSYQSKEFKDQRDNFFNNLQAKNAERPEGINANN